MIIYSILITGSTYAYLYLENNNSIISGTGKCEGINYKGENISNSNLVSTTNYLEGAKSTIHLSSSNDCQIYTLVSIYLHTNDSTTSPITTVFALKYKVFQGDNQISEGVIDQLGDKKIATVPLTDVDTSYDVYLYIDSSISKGSFNDTLYSGYLYASSYQSSSVDRFLVRDLSYYTNDAVSYGALLDKSNGIVTTDGIDDYIDAGYANYDFKDSVTLISRFKCIKSNGVEEEIIVNYENAGVGLIIENKKLIFGIMTNESNYYSRSSYSEDINYNEWYTAVGTYDGNIMKLYLNGKLVATTNVSGTIAPSPEPFHFSSNPTSTGEPSVFSNFTYSDALLYDRTLSEEEIMEVFSGEINKNKVSWDELLFYYDFK